MKVGQIKESPVRHVEKPRTGRRDVVITRAEYASRVGQVRDEEFRELLVVCWETGCPGLIHKPADAVRFVEGGGEPTTSSMAAS